MTDLYHKYRPSTLKEVVGQNEAVKMLSSMIKTNTIPHAILFTGPSGCGKTTLARILKNKLNCGDLDYTEINAADDRGIDMSRSIKDRMRFSPISGKTRIWTVDEAQQLTSAAQNALLKLLEDPPKSAYIFICTTDPAKIIRTIITRCTEIKVKPVSDKALTELLNYVIEKEITEESPNSPSGEVVERIVEVSDGSARKALVLLHQIIKLGSEELQLSAISNSDPKRVTFDLVKALMPFNGRVNWSEVKTTLEVLKGEEPEGIRRLIISVCSTQMLKGNAKAFKVFNAFRDNYYDTGYPGLVASCFEAVYGK